jgi:hypothetical protein
LCNGEKKNELVEQDFAYKLFLQAPDTVESIAFFAVIRKKCVVRYASVPVKDEEVAVVVESVDSPESPDNDKVNDDEDVNDDDDDAGNVNT